MGRQSKLKKIASDSKLYLSANAQESMGVSAGSSSGTSEEPLEISLIRLNLDLLAKAKIGDNVSVDVQSTPFKVFTAKGAVGNIPHRFEEAIIQRRLFSGFIIHLRSSPPGLRIRL